MRAPSVTTWLVLLCAIGTTYTPAAANVVLNGSFEQGTFTGGPAGSQQVQPGDSTTISNWTVSGAPVTWYASGNNLNQIALSPHSGNLGLNLADGTSNTVTVGETINNLLPFVEYQLSFWVGNYSANNSPVSLVVQVRDGTSNTILKRSLVHRAGRCERDDGSHTGYGSALRVWSRRIDPARMAQEEEA